MTFRLYSGAPENIQFLNSSHRARLSGMNFKTTNFLLFKLIRGYWFIDEIGPDKSGREKIVCYHKVLFEIEIKPFWKFNKY